jgi:hypothetical protein
MREMASGLQFPEGPVALDDGSVLVGEIPRGTVTRVDLRVLLHRSRQEPRARARHHRRLLRNRFGV